MKRALLVGALVAGTVLGFSSSARADHNSFRWGIGFGFGSGGSFVSGGFGAGHRRRHVVHRPVVHRHVRVPIYVQTWVAPVYDTVFVGYDHCGRPIYQQVLACEGYYRTVVSGYRCGTCSVACD